LNNVQDSAYSLIVSSSAGVVKKRVYAHKIRAIVVL